MKKRVIGLMILFLILTFEEIVYGDAGPIYLLVFPTYFIFIGFFTVGFSMYSLTRAIINIKRLLKVTSINGDNRLYLKLLLFIIPSVLLIAVVVCVVFKFLMYLLFSISIFTIIICFVLSFIIHKLPDIDRVNFDGKSIFNYSLFIIGLNVIFIIGWIKCIR